MTTEDERKAVNAAFKAKRKQELRDTFQPYGVALAYLIFHWNRLHEALSLSFIMLVNPREFSGHSLRSGS
jgi:hypothetical protein